MYSTIVEWSVLSTSLRYCWLMVLLSPSVDLLVFCLVVLSIVERGALKSPTIIINLSISPCSSINFSHIYQSSDIRACVFLIHRLKRDLIKIRTWTLSHGVTSWYECARHLGRTSSESTKGKFLLHWTNHHSPDTSQNCYFLTEISEMNLSLTSEVSKFSTAVYYNDYLEMESAPRFLIRAPKNEFLNVN